MGKCPENTATTLSAEDARNLGIEMDVRGAVADLIGNEDRVALKWKNGTALEARAYAAWIRLRDGLVEQLMNNTKIAGQENYRSNSYLKMIQDYVQKQLKVQAHPSTLFEQANPHRIIAVANLVQGLIKLQNSRFGKKLNPWERAFLPVTMFAMRTDPFGYVYKYAVRATNVHEDSRQAASPYKDKYHKIMASYIRNLENSLAMLPFVSPDHIYSNRPISGLDDIDENDPFVREEGIAGMVTKNKQPIIYFGTIERADTTRVHLVLNDKTGIKEELPFNMLSRETINRAVVDKYSNELTNDIMHGQARHVTWRDQVSKEHKPIIERMFRVMNFKSEVDKKDAEKGMPDLHFTQIGDTKINYVMLRDGVIETNLAGEKQVTIQGEEKYSAYIVSMQKSGEKRQNFFVNNTNPIESIRSQGRNRLRDGFYRTQDYRTYGKRVS